MKTMIYNPENRKKLPETTGVYRFTDPEGEVLYIGKSVNVKSRVNSYFIKRGLGERPDKLHRMNRFIAFIEVTPTPTELEAEWLEQALIERHQPQYNQQMKNNARHGFLMLEAGAGIWRWRVVALGKERNLLQEKKESALFIGPFRNPKAIKVQMEILKNFKWLENWSYQAVPITYSKEELGKIIYWIKEKFKNRVEYDRWIQKIRQERDRAAKNLEFEKARRFHQVIESLAPVGHAFKRKQLLYQGDLPFMIDRKNEQYFGYYFKKGVLFRKSWKLKESEENLKKFVQLIHSVNVSMEEGQKCKQWILRNLDQEMILYRAFVEQKGKIIGCGIKIDDH